MAYFYCFYCYMLFWLMIMTIVIRAGEGCDVRRHMKFTVKSFKRNQGDMQDTSKRVMGELIFKIKKKQDHKLDDSSNKVVGRLKLFYEYLIASAELQNPDDTIYLQFTSFDTVKNDSCIFFQTIMRDNIIMHANYKEILIVVTNSNFSILTINYCQEKLQTKRQRFIIQAQVNIQRSEQATQYIFDRMIDKQLDFIQEEEILNPKGFSWGLIVCGFFVLLTYNLKNLYKQKKLRNKIKHLVQNYLKKIEERQKQYLLKKNQSQSNRKQKQGRHNLNIIKNFQN